jgi:superfamily I DNA/RNA helicase
LPGRRYHAVVVDEGQDFEARWFELLQRLLVDPDDVFWVFHDRARRSSEPTSSLGWDSSATSSSRTTATRTAAHGDQRRTR